MPIPFSTTMISIVRSTMPDTQDKYDPPSDITNPATKVVVANVRAVVTVPSGSTNLIAGQRVSYNTTLTCDPCDLQEGDIVTESTGLMWVCLSANPFNAFALSGVKAALRRVTGFAA